MDVDELVLVESLVDHRQAACLDEPARGEGREAELVGATLGLEPSFDRPECALRSRRGRRVWERQMDPKPMVARPVLEGRRDVHCRVVGVDLDGGLDHVFPATNAPLAAGLDVFGQGVGRDDLRRGSDRA